MLKLNAEMSKVNIRVHKPGYVTEIVNLSDLFEKIEWLRKNDDKARQIGLNG